MTTESWDVDQAVTRGPLDADLEGCSSFDRYGVLGVDEIAGEPLEVALAQEEPDVAPFVDIDDPWLFIDREDDERALDALDGDGPEAGALHVVTP